VGLRRREVPESRVEVAWCLRRAFRHCRGQTNGDRGPQVCISRQNYYLSFRSHLFGFLGVQERKANGLFVSHLSPILYTLRLHTIRSCQPLYHQRATTLVPSAWIAGHHPSLPRQSHNISDTRLIAPNIRQYDSSELVATFRSTRRVSVCPLPTSSMAVSP
jgi:hypothetical protein